MKRLMNMTTSYHDLPRYADNADLKQGYGQFGLDGLELMVYGEDERGIVAADDVVGSHLRYFHHWVPVWRRDEPAMLAEYGDLAAVESAIGGRDAQALVQAFRENMGLLLPYAPEYAVMHVSDVTLRGCITREHPLSDAQVIAAQIELANAVFDDSDWHAAVLFENLWWPGMTMINPDLVYELLAGVSYPNCGVMLDIGHLLHTNLELRSREEGIDYIYQVLSRYDNLDFIKGVHLHQTLSGAYSQNVMARPFEVRGSYMERALAVQQHVLRVDSHQPFISPRVLELIEYIDPQYLVLELITSNREQHEHLLARQMQVL